MSGKLTSSYTNPTYLGQDLWQALDLPMDDFLPYLQRNGWGGTWAALIAEVKIRSGIKLCGMPDDDGNPCVLLEHDTGFPHYAAGDVGKSEPLPERFHRG